MDQIEQPAQATVIVTVHQPRRRNRRSITCWCGAKVSTETDPLEHVDTSRAVYESCPLCQAAQIVDRLKLKDLFEAADPQ